MINRSQAETISSKGVLSDLTNTTPNEGVSATPNEGVADTTYDGEIGSADDT